MTELSKLKPIFLPNAVNLLLNSLNASISSICSFIMSAPSSTKNGENIVTDLINTLPDNIYVNSPTRNNGSCVLSRRMLQLVARERSARQWTNWRSRGNPNRGVSTIEVVFSVHWSVQRLHNASPLEAKSNQRVSWSYGRWVGVDWVSNPVPGGITGPPCSWGI
jgi:hypothetical protein